MDLPQDKLVIHWLTDIHLMDSVEGKPEAKGAVWKNRHYYASRDKLRQAADIICREGPDLAVCTGDMTDGIQPLIAFVREWSRISCPKEIMIGNHDLPNGRDALERQLGYENQPLIAGSRFNRSFAMHKGGIRLRIVMLDVNAEEEDALREDSCKGLIREDAFLWLEQELAQAPEKMALVFTHNGIYGPESYFEPSHAVRFTEMIEKLSRSKPDLQVINLAGHHHVHPQAIHKSITPHLSFINGVALIVGPVSYVNVLTILEDGSMTLDYREIAYSYGGMSND